MRNCQIGWIDIFFWNDWKPGVIPESSDALRAYEKKLAVHIISERYTLLLGEGFSMRIGFREYDDDDGADITVYVRFTANSVEELAEKAKYCITYVPECHAFDLLCGDIVLTEDDFDDCDNFNDEALERLQNQF